jgi:hypothetical protein
MDPPSTQGIARIIELAVAPVFVLSAIAATLALLASRLARVVDRGRALEQGGFTTYPGGVAKELKCIEARARWILRGMGLCTVSAIQVSLLICLAFFGYALRINVGGWLAALFVGAMIGYTGALLCLLREVYLATSTFTLVPPEQRTH